MAQSSSTEAQATEASRRTRSADSLRRIATSFSGAGVVAALASVETAARELSKAARLRRRRQREREEEREQEREERLRERRRRRDDDDDGDDDDLDRIAMIRAKHAALMNRNGGGDRRVNAKQDADDDQDETAAERRARRRAEQDDADDDADDASTVRESRQFVPDLGLTDSSSSSSSTSTASDAEEIRVGDSDTWASIDPETGTATAFSNGVSAIAGPDGASIEGSPSTPSSGQSTGSPDDFDDGDFDDLDDLEDPDDTGGNNGDELLS